MDDSGVTFGNCPHLRFTEYTDDFRKREWSALLPGMDAGHRYCSKYQCAVALLIVLNVEISTGSHQVLDYIRVTLLTGLRHIVQNKKKSRRNILFHEMTSVDSVCHTPASGPSIFVRQ